MGLNELIAVLQASGWHITPFSHELRAATGWVAGGWREGWDESVWRCPECGGVPEPAPWEVEGRAVQGWACPACGALGLEEHLPRERRVIHRAWTEEELAQEVERYRPRPVARSLGEEVRRKEAWARERLEALLEEVRSAPSGMRNNTLASAAYRAGALLRRYAVGGLEGVLERLVEAAVAAGLPRAEARSTAERGLRKGFEGGA